MGLDERVVDDYRMMYDYNHKFDVVLGTFYEPCQAELIPNPCFDSLERKLDFNKNLNKIFKILGMKMFVPYTDIDKSWPAEKILDIVNCIIVPSSRLVVCDSEIPSPVDPRKTSLFVEGIVKSAHDSRIPVIHLHRTPPDNMMQYPEAMPFIDRIVHYLSLDDAYLHTEIAAMDIMRSFL